MLSNYHLRRRTMDPSLSAVADATPIPLVLLMRRNLSHLAHSSHIVKAKWSPTREGLFRGPAFVI